MPASAYPEKFYYTYNAEGNILKIERQNFNSPRETLMTFTAWDDKINPLYKQAPENWFEFRDPFGNRSSSVHNPTRFIDAESTIEHQFNITYNEQGYPLSFKTDKYPVATFLYEYIRN